MNKIKSAEIILDKWYKPRMHWKTFNRGQVIKAMEEYHAQFKQADISEDVEKAADDYASQFHGDYDNNCTEDAACNGFKAGAEWQIQRPIPTVDEDVYLEVLKISMGYDKNHPVIGPTISKRAKKLKEHFSITRK